MVRRAGTMLRACGCEHVPHEGGIQLGGKSRGRTIRLGSRRLLAVNLLDQVQLYVEVGRPKLHFPCKRSTCQCQGRRSQSVSKAWQRGQDMTKYSTTASLAHTPPLLESVAPATLKPHTHLGLLVPLQELTCEKTGSRAACHCCPSAISKKGLCKQQQKVFVITVSAFVLQNLFIWPSV